MSSHLAGRLRVERQNRRLVAIARRTLDARSFAQWVAAGRAGALEASRLLDAAADARVSALERALSPDTASLGLPVDELVAIDRMVLVAAASDALADAGFEVDVTETRDSGFSLLGRQGDQTISIRLDRDETLVVDAGVLGFESDKACVAARDAVVRRLEDMGVGVGRPDDTASVSDAVASALPGFVVRTLVEGDELQIVAWPRERE